MADAGKFSSLTSWQNSRELSIVALSAWRGGDFILTGCEPDTAGISVIVFLLVIVILEASRLV